MAKRALITGITGQDGAYLARFLLEKGYNVFGMYRRVSTPNFWRLQALDIFEKVELIPGDMADTNSLLECVTIAQPDEIYNLAAQSFVGASFEAPLLTANVDALGVTRLLEIIRMVNPKIKFYQASSSEIYGNVNSDYDEPLNENSLREPASPYAAAKLYAFNIVKIYREAYGIFAVNGILFNHESPLRGLEFVTRKISNAVAKIFLGIQDEVVLGNLFAERDWGYAPEYIEAMWLMLQRDEPDDYVIATGESHSVKEFAKEAFKVVGLNWEKYCKTNKRFFRPLDVNRLVGDPTKAKKELGWSAKVRFKELARIMVEEDLKKWKLYLKGEIFPWDAPNYPSENKILSRSLRM